MEARAWTLVLAATFLVASQMPARGGDERKRRFVAKDAKAALAWQASSRALLWKLLALDDLVRADLTGAARPGIELKVEVLATRDRGEYLWHEIGMQSTATRRIKAIVTVPKPAGGAGATKHPAVVCIHGHGGSRLSPYDVKGPYRGFGLSLARRGYVTISTDVGQHKVYEKGRTLMGERLWDLMRCVTYLTSRPDVDAGRIGCAGLSLGGEMAMWLGAMDTRVTATVSSGFLTTVANLRRGHCRCWEFPGLTAHFDFADIYSLTAPRALCCQNGRKERAPGGFPVTLAEGAMREIQVAYRVLGKPHNAVLVAHPAGHVVDLPSCTAFLDKHLSLRSAGTPPGP